MCRDSRSRETAWHYVTDMARSELRLLLLTAVAMAGCSGILGSKSGGVALFGTDRTTKRSEELSPHEARLMRPFSYDTDELLTRARTDCPYGSATCSPCVQGLLPAFEASRGGVDIRGADQHFEVDGYEADEGVLFNHIQGVARLADVIHGDGTRTGRMVLTGNLSAGGLSYAERTLSTDEDTVFAPGSYEVQRELDIRQSFSHPGGAQAHGDTMVVAMDGAPDHTAVYFLAFPPGGNPVVANRVFIDGSRGEPKLSRHGRWESASAAFIQLVTGRLLLAVAGGGNGNEGVWFYVSSEAVLRERTEWSFLGIWRPCEGSAGRAGLTQCFSGASGMALLADCSGDIYLVTMHGTSQSSEEFQWLQVFSLRQDTQGHIGLSLRAWQRDRTGRFQRNNPAFRWSGTVSVTSTPNVIAVLNTVRDPATQHCESVCGDVYWSKPSSPAPVPPNIASRLP